MIIGGIALIARGVRRMTTDIDAAVRGDAVRVDALLRTLKRHAIVPRVPRAKAFAEANLVLLLRHAPTGVDLDVSLAWSGFEHDALEASTEVRFGRVKAPMSTAADLVVFKAIAGRPRDLDDVEALLVLYPKIDIARARARIAELAKLADAPELSRGFDTAVRRTRGRAARRYPRPRRGRRP
jgi:hypothetical protein